jgi:4'-phosphopantetheinyl transferase
MSDAVGWAVPEEAPRLEENEVHVWRVDLDAENVEAGALATRLADDERTRAARFRFERDRDRFLRRRVALRRILAGYLDRSPEALAFVQGHHGKPALADPGAAGRLEFNLTHSGGCALVAVVRGRRVGVDVEQIRTDLATMEVARRFFARGEVDALAAVVSDERTTAFYRCWTRKEAYVKARGDGLSLSLDRFEVPLAPGAAHAVASSQDYPADAMRWGLRELVPTPSHLGAVVVEGAEWTLRTWVWPPARPTYGWGPRAGRSGPSRNSCA